MAKLVSKRSRSLLVLLLMLVALGGVYALVSGIANAESDDSLAAGDPFLSVSLDEIAEVSWTYSGKTATMVKENDVWVDAEAEGVSLDQSAAADLASSVVDARSSRSVSRSQEDEAMGLENPTVQATLVLTDGSSISFEVGTATADDVSCYARSDESEDVQVVGIDLLNAFSCSISDLYVMDPAPNSTDVTAFEVKQDNSVLSMTYLEEGSDAVYSSSYQWFLRDGENLRALDKSKVRTLVDEVNYLTWKSCVDTVYTDDDAVTYGFDEPTLTAKLSYTDSTTYEPDDREETQEVTDEYTLIIGAKADASSYFARPAGSTFVYTIDAETVEDLLGATYETLRPDDVCLMDWDTVESLDIVNDGETTRVSFVRTEEQNDDGEAAVSTSYEVDGASVDASAVSSITNAIDGLTAEGEGTKDAIRNKQAELSITFNRSSSTHKTMTMRFFRYDNSFYLVSFNGEERLLVNKNEVTALKDLIRAL